jgi:hypothetical protein
MHVLLLFLLLVVATALLVMLLLLLCWPCHADAIVVLAAAVGAAMLPVVRCLLGLP